MIVTLPLRLTGSGNPGYRQPNSVTVTYQNGNVLRNVSVINSTITISAFTMDMSSGYDANGYRVTNIVGFNGHELLKHCPRCNRAKPTTKFGYSGRVTTSTRDQSECNDCRSGY